MSKWGKFGFIAKLIVPTLVAAINPKLASLGTVIAHGISVAEELPAASNVDKLELVKQLVKDGAVSINTAAGKEVISISNLDAASTHVINAAVEVVKLAHNKADSVSSVS